MLWIAAPASQGAAGATGGGFVALAATMPVIDVLPIVALARRGRSLMAEIRAATNLTRNIVATLVVGRWAEAVDTHLATRTWRHALGDGTKIAPGAHAQRPASATS